MLSCVCWQNYKGGECMNKKTIMIILTASLLFFSSVLYQQENVQASNAPSSGVIVNSVNFRDQPSLSGNRIRFLQQGEQVQILEQVNSFWYHIQDQNGQTGYVSTQDQYIEVYSQSNSTNGTIVSSVSFRTGPSTSNPRTRYLQAGEMVTILSQPNSFWYEVRDQHNIIGFISSNEKFISTSYSANNETPSDTEIIEIPDVTTNADIISGVSFRTGPSTSHPRIRFLRTGEKVTILNQPNSFWYEVEDHLGIIGFVSSNSKYIETSYINEIVPDNQDTSNFAQKVIDAGMLYLGTPYEFGSSRSSTLTFDCSDFVRRAFIDGIGITLPTNSRLQANYVSNIGDTTTNWKDLKIGDLMFFMAYKGTSSSNYTDIDKSTETITHVSIYLGNGKVLHTYSKISGGVRIDDIANRHWEYRFIFGGSAF